MSTAVRNKKREMHSQIEKDLPSQTTTLKMTNKKEEKYHLLTITGLGFFIGLSILTDSPLLKELVVSSLIISLVLLNKIQERKKSSTIFLNNHFSKIIKN